MRGNREKFQSVPGIMSGILCPHTYTESPLVDAPSLRAGRGSRMDNVREDFKYRYHTNLDN